MLITLFVLDQHELIYMVPKRNLVIGDIACAVYRGKYGPYEIGNPPLDATSYRN